MTTLSWGTPEPAFPPREESRVSEPVTYKVTSVHHDESEPFAWALCKEDGTPIAWLTLEYGQWMFRGADTYGNPDENTASHIDLGNLDLETDFQSDREAAALESSEAVRTALESALRSKLGVYVEQTYDLALGVAKRRAERLEW